MRVTRKYFLFLFIICLAASLTFAQETKLREPDVVFVPTPEDVVKQMLTMAKVHEGDILYDLGCGDGRTVIMAAKDFGAKATGIDINPVRIQESKENAERQGMANSPNVTFRNEDLFEAEFSDATVVTLYLLPRLNVKLRPRLWRELKPGTRIVSHDFDMGDWEPEEEVQMGGHTVYLWTIPPDAASRAAE